MMKAVIMDTKPRLMGRVPWNLPPSFMPLRARGRGGGGVSLRDQQRFALAQRQRGTHVIMPATPTSAQPAKNELFCSASLRASEKRLVVEPSEASAKQGDRWCAAQKKDVW